MRGGLAISLGGKRAGLKPEKWGRVVPRGEDFGRGTRGRFLPVGERRRMAMAGDPHADFTIVDVSDACLSGLFCDGQI